MYLQSTLIHFLEWNESRSFRIQSFLILDKEFILNGTLNKSLFYFPSSFKRVNKDYIENFLGKYIGKFKIILTNFAQNCTLNYIIFQVCVLTD